MSAARKDVDEKLHALETYLATNPDAEKGWKEYLRWDDLQTELGRGKGANPASLERIGRLLQSGKTGMEQSEFADLHKSLAHYAALLEFARAPNQDERIKHQMGDLSRALAAYYKSSSTADAEDVGRLLGQFQAAGMAPEFVENLRGRFAEPNLRIRASADFIALMVNDPDKPIDETDNNFHDNIMGTYVVGTTHTTGYRTATLIPDENHAVMNFTVVGQTTSQTTGFHPPVTIESHGITTWQGHKRIVIDGDGYSAPCCATAEACTHTCIDCIDICGGRLKQRIATKKVYQSKPEAECVAAEHAETRVKARMESDSKEGLARQNENSAAKFRDPLQRWGAFPEDLHYSTTTDALWVRAREADASHLSASTAAPDFSDNSFLAIRVHESFVNNLLAASLGGRKIDKHEFLEGMVNLLGDIPDEQKPPEELTADEQKVLSREDREQYDRERRLAEMEWTITFADERPVTIEFANGGYAITIRGAKFRTAQEVQELNEGRTLEVERGAMNITARYKFERRPDGGLQAKRQGVLEIAPPGFGPDSKLSRKQIEEKTTLGRRFNTMFPEQIPLQGVRFATQPWRNVGMLISSTPPKAEGGWLSIDWRQATEAEAAAADATRKEAWSKKNWAKVKADAAIKSGQK